MLADRSEIHKASMPEMFNVEGKHASLKKPVDTLRKYLPIFHVTFTFLRLDLRALIRSKPKIRTEQGPKKKS